MHVSLLCLWVSLDLNKIAETVHGCSFLPAEGSSQQKIHRCTSARTDAALHRMKAAK